MSSSELSMIQQYLRGAAVREREVERVGPFVATFDRDDGHPYLNYAIPDEGAEPSGADVEALLEAYWRRGLVPRLEYLPDVAPAAEAALVAAGFEVEGRFPGMVCTPDDVKVVPAPDGIAIAEPVSDVDWLEMSAAQQTAFGVEGAADDAGAAERGRERLAAGGVALLARDVTTGAIVGGGVATVPDDGVTEIAGIGVLATHRRRGVAGALTSGLARAAFGGGVEVAWLTPGDEGAQRVYERAGFEELTTVLHLSVPRPASSEPDGRRASGG